MSVTYFDCRLFVQDPNRARRSAANALTTKSSASAIASKLSRLLEEDKNIKQVTYDWAGLHCAVLGRCLPLWDSVIRIVEWSWYVYESW
jgi:hypothetical protein